MNDPEGASARLLRIRWLLVGCAVFWAVALGVFLAGGLVPEQLSASEQNTLKLGLLGGTVLSAAAATVLRPGHPSGWGVAVMAAAGQLTICLLTPVGFYLLYLLFRPEVMRACLGPRMTR